MPHRAPPPARRAPHALRPQPAGPATASWWEPGY